MLLKRLIGKFFKVRLYLILKRKVSGRLKLRGNVANVNIDKDFYCDGDLWLGIYSETGQIILGPGTRASGPLTITAIQTVKIGANCLFGPNVFITDHSHGTTTSFVELEIPPSDRKLFSVGGTVLKNTVLVGANCCILSGAIIESKAIIGANTVVNKAIPEAEVWAGTPAKKIKTMIIGER